jgi:YihY family inner membrane protein
VDIGASLRRIDRAQQRHRWSAFPVAVVKKYGDDQGSNLAALVAHYAFFSLFPLLLVFVTVLGFVLAGDPSLQREVVNGALNQFPVVGNKLQVGSFHGSGLALAIGLVGALWAGLGVTLAAENAMNSVWNVPLKQRPDFLKSRLRGLTLLAILGTLNLAATVIGGVVGGGVLHGVPANIAGVIVALLADFVLFFAAFRLLTAHEVSRHDLLPGVILATVLWYALQTLGGLYINHVVKGAGETYGVFALVIGLLSFLHLGAQLILIAAEVNVVRARHLWPRNLFGGDLRDEDRRALTADAKAQERVPQQQIDVAFHD